jgi:DnaK suppressor protein
MGGRNVDIGRARELVAAERQRIEAALRQLGMGLRAQSDLEVQQEGETDAGSELATEMVEQGLVADLRTQLAAVARAEARIEAGTYGRSIDSGVPIPDDRLQAEPLAERTVEEQRHIDRSRRPT